jgi:hypothetical protein
LRAARFLRLYLKSSNIDHLLREYSLASSSSYYLETSRRMLSLEHARLNKIDQRGDFRAKRIYSTSSPLLHYSSSQTSIIIAPFNKSAPSTVSPIFPIKLTLTKLRSNLPTPTTSVRLFTYENRHRTRSSFRNLRTILWPPGHLNWIRVVFSEGSGISSATILSNTKTRLMVKTYNQARRQQGNHQLQPGCQPLTHSWPTATVLLHSARLQAYSSCHWTVLSL